MGKRELTLKIDDNELEVFDKNVGKIYNRSEVIRMLMKAYVKQDPWFFKQICLIGRLVGVEVDDIEKKPSVHIDWDLVTLEVPHSRKPEKVVAVLKDTRIKAVYENTAYFPLSNIYVYTYQVPRYHVYIDIKVDRGR